MFRPRVRFEFKSEAKLTQPARAFRPTGWGVKQVGEMALIVETRNTFVRLGFKINAPQTALGDRIKEG